MVKVVDMQRGDDATKERMEQVAFLARLLTLDKNHLQLEQCFDVLLHNAFDTARTDKASMLTESVTSDKAILAW